MKLVLCRLSYAALKYSRAMAEDPGDEARDIIAKLKVQRAVLIESQETLRTKLAQNISLLREIDETIAEAQAML